MGRAWETFRGRGQLSSRQKAFRRMAQDGGGAAHSSAEAKAARASSPTVGAKFVPLHGKTLSNATAEVEKLREKRDSGKKFTKKDEMRLKGQEDNINRTIAETGPKGEVKRAMKKLGITPKEAKNIAKQHKRGR